MCTFLAKKLAKMYNFVVSVLPTTPTQHETHGVYKVCLCTLRAHKCAHNFQHTPFFAKTGKTALAETGCLAQHVKGDLFKKVCVLSGVFRPVVLPCACVHMCTKPVFFVFSEKTRRTSACTICQKIDQNCRVSNCAQLVHTLCTLCAQFAKTVNFRKSTVSRWCVFRGKWVHFVYSKPPKKQWFLPKTASRKHPLYISGTSVLQVYLDPPEHIGKLTENRYAGYGETKSSCFVWKTGVCTSGENSENCDFNKFTAKYA